MKSNKGKERKTFFTSSIRIVVRHLKAKPRNKK